MIPTRTRFILILTSLLLTAAVPNGGVMARGYPDGGVQNYGTAVNQPDFGETGIRLLMGGGSMSRTGRLIWATGFENSLSASDFNTYGPNALIKPGNFFDPYVAVVAAAWQGNNYFQVATRANTVGDFAQFSKNFPASSATGKWGLEAMSDFEDIGFGDADYVMTGNDVNVTVRYTGTVRFSLSSSGTIISLYIQVPGPSWQLIATLTGKFATNGSGIYHDIKIVNDIVNGRYGYVQINNVRYDLSAYSMPSSAVGTPTQAQAIIRMTTNDVYQVALLIDNVIITCDEP